MGFNPIRERIWADLTRFSASDFLPHSPSIFGLQNSLSLLSQNQRRRSGVTAAAAAKASPAIDQINCTARRELDGWRSAAVPGEAAARKMKKFSGFG